MMVSTVIVALGLALQPATGPPPADAETCLACHAEAGLEMAFGDGTTRSLRVDAGALAGSVHAGEAGCVDCHPDAREIPHPERGYRTPRQFRVAASERCQRCHFSDYRRTLDSVHAGAVSRGDLTAPVCVDCHGSHDMRRPGEPRTRVADTCAACHAGVAKAHAESVHGRDVARNMADVPTCTDCHRAHDIGGPHQRGWKTGTPDICGGCHADPERMRPYGLSTAVLRTYAADFHGKTASLRRNGKDRGSGAGQPFVALCTDCHGTHDIVRVDERGSRVVRENLASTCRRCHPDASDAFPDAWLSHYEPSWERTPAMYAVKIGYAVFIPFIIGGLVLQMLLHLWRMAVNR